MNIKKTLISVGLSAALSAMPFIAQADLISQTAITAGVEVLVKDSASLTGQQLVLTENLVGAVSAGTIVLILDNNAEFVEGTAIGTGLTASASVTSGKLTITVTPNAGTSLGKITISGIKIKTSSSSVGSEIKISKDSGSTATGATFPALKIATIVEPSAKIENASGTTPSFKAGLTAKILDIFITENAEGAINTTADDGIIVSLPTGWTFDGTSSNKLTMKATSGKVTISKNIKAPDSASNGDVKATVTVKLSNDETKNETLVVGKVEESGIKAIVVDKSTTAFDAEKAAATKVPEVPIGKLNAQLNSIMVVENFGNDLTADDKLVLTLPTGVKFTSTGAANLDQKYITLGTVADPNSDNTFTIPITDAGTDLTSANSKGGVLIIKSGIIVNIAEDAPEGDIKAVLTGKVNGNDIAAIELVIGKIIKGGTKNEANSDIKTVGVGSSNVEIAEFTLTEIVPGALKGNNKTITLTLPDGVTWTDKTSKPACTGSNITIGPIDSFTDGDKVATFPVTTVSTSTAGKITCTGNINIKADFKPGDIEVTIGGTAGATEGKVLVAKAATGTSVSVGDVPQLKAGVSAKAIATITINEAFAGSLSKNGKFRIQLPEGLVWTAAVPTISTELKSGESGTKLSKDGWGFELKTTITVNDTVVITVPSAASTGATVISFAELKINIPDGRADGLIEVKLFDGDAAGQNGAGVTEESKLLVGIIGEIPEFKVDPLTVKVAVGDTVEVTTSGGLGTAKVGTVADATIATATIENGKVTITGVKEGKTSVVVSDGSATAQTKTVEIEVTAAAALDVAKKAVDVEEGKTVEVKITGGTAGYTVTSSADATATATLKDKTITIKGVKEGTATITVEDSATPTKGKVEIVVTVKKAGSTPTPTPPPLTGPNKDGKGSGIDKDGKKVSSEAKFYGGVSTDGGATYSSEIPADKAITVNVKIEVDPKHEGKKGKYYVVAGYQPDATKLFWWFYKEDKTFVDWAPVDLATRVAYKETDALGTVEIELAKNLSLKDFKGKYFVFLAYETEDGSIYFNLPAIEFEQK